MMGFVPEPNLQAWGWSNVENIPAGPRYEGLT